MLEPENPNTPENTEAPTASAGADSALTPPTPAKRTRKAAARRVPPAIPAFDSGAIETAAAEPVSNEPTTADATSALPAKSAPRKSAPRKAAPRKAVGTPLAEPAEISAGSAELLLALDAEPASDSAPAEVAPRKTARKRAAKKVAEPARDAVTEQAVATEPIEAPARAPRGRAIPTVLFVAPTEAEAVPAPARRRATRASMAIEADPAEVMAEAIAAELDVEQVAEELEELEEVRESAADEATGARRRRRRGRRGRGRARDDASEDDDTTDTTDADSDVEASGDTDDSGAEAGAGATNDEQDESPTGDSHRRRRRRRSSSADGDAANDDPPNTVTHVREKRSESGRDSGRDSGREDDGVRGVKGSTRLEAKRQRRRDGRDTGRKRPSILSEAEFLARREAVDRVMAVRQLGDRTQIAVLEDSILVEHYVTRASATSYVGNVYLGRVQNVLPSMEAAFIDIGKGRNGVLYAGEVNWDAAGLEGKARNIESALNAGDSILVQVTKDPIGHKGARLTSQISLPGRFLVFVPGGGMTGISRKLPDTERTRLKAILKKIVPEDAGVIIRTAAEGASEEELTHDVLRLTQEWDAISAKADQKKSAPVQLHGEPDLAIRVVRDVFNEDFKQLIVEGEDAWQTISDYVGDVAPDLAERVSRHTGDKDLFRSLRVDEQLAKALDRKVYLPSGGSLVIDRTEAMTVIDVNTGKYIGSGGNLEQTVTRNNLEAAEEIVRQLRLRDVGGIVVIDFIDMVLESNRDLVLRRLTECLGRDRTKHQVAEVTSLGLVQMTRKRVGEGLLEAFSEPCEVCHGRGVIVHSEPIFIHNDDDVDEQAPPKRRSRRERGGGGGAASTPVVEDIEQIDPAQRRAAASAMAAIAKAAQLELDAQSTAEPGDAAESDPAEVAEVAEVIEAVDVAGASEVTEVVADPTESFGAVGFADPSEAAEPRGPIESAGPTEPAEPAEPAVEQEALFAAAEPVVVLEPTVVGRSPRRRRAASRPAGPPLEPVGPA